jgi:hypothetical protein
MLVNLRQRLKPRNNVRRLQLTEQYRELQKLLKNKNLNIWITSWEKVYREGIALTQPIVQKDIAVQDFLRAVFDLAPDFSSFWTNTIQNIDDEHQRPDLYAVIDRFRIYRQILGVESRSAPRAAFGATLQGQQQEERPRTPCVYGKYYRYS